MVTRKECFTLISYFKRVFKDRYGQEPHINVYQARWEAESIIESYGMPVSKSLIDRYIALSSSPSWTRFIYTTEALYNDMVAIEKDEQERKLARERAVEWMK